MYIYMMVINMIVIGVILWMLFLYFYLNKITLFMEYDILSLNSIKLELLVLLDWISLLFISVLMFITAMILLYSMEYMFFDNQKNRFFMMIFMFVMSMILMILSPNLMSILLGWDGLGLVSYCLVIYYQSKGSFNSGMVTVLMNRVGDVMILLSITLMLCYGSMNLMFMNKLDKMIMIMLLIASFTKSAQLPFSSWLPMAMAAPTPVSALVHSSTLVTAGVYLVIRLNYMMDNEILVVMMLLSSITMFYSGVGANLECDLKKIIALSTLSQLSIMFFCLSMKMEEFSVFHMLIHAMFKSMLFMCAGVIIHNMMGVQDIRFINFMLFNSPMVSLMFSCSIMSLCGVPFMSGFYSKDLILEMYMMGGLNKFSVIMLFLSMGLTLMYSFRLMYFTFIKIPNLLIYKNYSSLSFMGVSMLLLFFFSIINGSVLSWILMIGDMTLIYLTIYNKLMIYYYLGMGLLMGGLLNKVSVYQILILKYSLLINFNKNLWFMTLLYGLGIKNILKSSKKMINYFEMGWVEYIIGGVLYQLMNLIFKIDYFKKNYKYLMVLIILMILFNFF